MTARRVVTMRVVGARSGTVEAAGPGVIRALGALGCPRQAKPGGIWQAPARFADELEARLTAAGFEVRWAL